MEPVQSRTSQGRVSDAPTGHWVYRALPRAAWPYAQLARWDRPIGWHLLMWPCWWSAAMAFSAPGSPQTWAGFAAHLVLFAVGAIAMRGAGCTWNDLSDEQFDAKVERTRSRPLPSGKVTRRQAYLFLGAQGLAGLAVLLMFNRFTIWTGLASLAVLLVYPFMKRITDWPQFVLGLAFSWGALMGWAAVFGRLDAAAFALYAGSILWVIGYDTIYAHQDKEDDALIGVRSTARLFGRHTKAWLAGLYGGALALMAIAFALVPVPVPALAGLVAAGVHMAGQIRRLDIDNPAQCLSLFRSNFTVGMLVFAGLIAGAIWPALKSLI